jgi:hypothetical protein
MCCVAVLQASDEDDQSKVVDIEDTIPDDIRNMELDKTRLVVVIIDDNCNDDDVI